MQLTNGTNTEGGRAMVEQGDGGIVVHSDPKLTAQNYIEL